MESKKSWFRSTKVWKLPQRLSIIIILLYLIGKSIRLLFAFPLGSHANSSCSSFPDFSIPFIVKIKAPKWIWTIGTHLHPVPRVLFTEYGANCVKTTYRCCVLWRHDQSNPEDNILSNLKIQSDSSAWKAHFFKLLLISFLELVIFPENAFKGYDQKMPSFKKNISYPQNILFPPYSALSNCRGV